MDQNSRKQLVARAALEFIKPGTALGVGTGSTVNYFIDELERFRGAPDRRRCQLPRNGSTAPGPRIYGPGTG